MSRRTRTASAAVILVLSVGAGSASAAHSSADTAALQVALWARGVYVGPVDGVFGPDTAAAVRALQNELGLPNSGVFGPRTRRALGRYATKTLGSRRLGSGMNGWDVAAFQFMLAWHGFPSGAFNGAFSPRTESALISFERWAGLPADGLAGPAVLRALHRPRPRSPISLGWPLIAPLGSPFGPRGDGFHAGIDLVAPAGDPVIAAGAGQVVYAGWRDGGWGNEVTINHGYGVRAIYAHLSKITVTLGESVSGGERIGLVGATGAATGPHLHFELRLNGAAVDPLTSLPTVPPTAGPAAAPGGALERLPADNRPGGAGARARDLLPVSAVDALGPAVLDQAAQAASHRLPGNRVLPSSTSGAALMRAPASRRRRPRAPEPLLEHADDTRRVRVGRCSRWDGATRPLDRIRGRAADYVRCASNAPRRQRTASQTVLWHWGQPAGGTLARTQ